MNERKKNKHVQKLIVKVTIEQILFLFFQRSVFLLCCIDWFYALETRGSWNSQSITTLASTIMWGNKWENTPFTFRYPLPTPDTHTTMASNRSMKMLFLKSHNLKQYKKTINLQPEFQYQEYNNTYNNTIFLHINSTGISLSQQVSFMMP